MITQELNTAIAWNDTNRRTPAEQPAPASAGRVVYEWRHRLQSGKGWGSWTRASLKKYQQRDIYPNSEFRIVADDGTRVAARELDVEAERLEFEAHAKSKWYAHGLESFSAISGEYTYDEAQAAWEAWLAARSAAQGTQADSAPVSTEQAGDAQSVRNAALEAAASLCDRFAARDMHAAECAGAIRMMKAAPSPNNSPVGGKD